MVPPLAIQVTTDTLRRWLLVLKRAPAARVVYRYTHIRVLVVSFIARTYFTDLREAVSAATSMEYMPENVVMRNVTLPAPIDYDL